MKERIGRLEECVKLYGKKVKALHRTKIGMVSVKNLKIGEWRYLTEKEVKDLQK